MVKNNNAESGYWATPQRAGFQAQLIKLPFHEVTFFPGDHYFFHYLDEEGAEHSVPFHRIKAVYKEGELIWYREH